METSLLECLMDTMFRIKKAGLPFPSGHGLHMGELAALQLLAEYPALEKQGISELHQRLYVTRPAVSQMFNALEKKGFIMREVDPDDRRKFIVKPTAKGYEAMNGMRQQAEALFSTVVTRFGEENIKQMIALFHQFADISEEVRQEMTQSTGDEQYD